MPWQQRQGKIYCSRGTLSGLLLPTPQGLSPQHCLLPRRFAFQKCLGGVLGDRNIGNRLQQPTDVALAGATVHADIGPTGPQDCGFAREGRAGPSDAAVGNAGASAADNNFTCRSSDLGGANEGQHMEVRQDVILRLETITSGETKYIIAVTWTASTLAFGAMIAEFVVKLKRNNTSSILHHNTIATVNVVVASILCCQLLRSLGWLSFVVAKTWRLKKKWKRRRAYAVIVFFIEILAQTVNVGCYLAMNALALRDKCYYLKKATFVLGGLQWTCWNTVFLAFCVQVGNQIPLKGSRHRHRMSAGISGFKADAASEQSGRALQTELHSHTEAIVATDGSIWWHAPKFGLWLVTQATLITLIVFEYRHTHSHITGAMQDNCATAIFECEQSPTQIGLTCGVCFCCLLYCLWFSKYLTQLFLRLKRLPYTEYRIVNLLVRLHLRLRFPFIASFVLCFVLLWAVKVNSCFSFAVSWQGLLPMQVIETSVIVAWSFIAMPKDPKGSPPLMQVWLQEICWAHSSKAARIQQRNSSAPDDGALTSAPMFCFEDAMKCLYWTLLVYDYKQAERTILNLDAAKQLYGLEEDELLWEPLHDTKCLMAWGSETILLVFRGTASFKNAKADVQVWRVPHPPRRGRYWLGQQPQVHAGFLKSWLVGDLKDRVIARVLLHLQQQKGNTVKRVLVTGHSLGGALATLCAYDVAAAIRDSAHATGADASPTVEVSCYTFGAPRTGNKAFMKEYNALVPDSWAIINDQDVVTRGGKLVFLYSRPGQRVLINGLGDMIVRPSWVEASLRRVAMGSVNHHLLAQYTNSMLAVILQQFDNKVVTGGIQGVIQMCQENHVLAAMLERFMGLSLEDMQASLTSGKRGKPLSAKLPKLGFYVKEVNTPEGETSYKWFACCT